MCGIALPDVNPRDIALAVLRIANDIEKPYVHILIHFRVYMPLDILTKILNKGLFVFKLDALDSPLELFLGFIDAYEYASTLFVKKCAVKLPESDK